MRRQFSPSPCAWRGRNIRPGKIQHISMKAYRRCLNIMVYTPQLSRSAARDNNNRHKTRMQRRIRSPLLGDCEINLWNLRRFATSCQKLTHSIAKFLQVEDFGFHLAFKLLVSLGFARGGCDTPKHHATASPGYIYITAVLDLNGYSVNRKEKRKQRY